MEKTTKSYVSYFFLGIEWQDKEIQERDPESVNSIVDLNDVASFYFYDQTFTKKGEEIHTGERENVSKLIYVGKRLTIEEAIGLSEGYIREYLEQLIKSNRGVVSICQTNRGLYEMYEEDITLDEYILNKNNSKKI